MIPQYVDAMPIPSPPGGKRPAGAVLGTPALLQAMWSVTNFVGLGQGIEHGLLLRNIDPHRHEDLLVPERPCAAPRRHLWIFGMTTLGRASAQRSSQCRRRGRKRQPGWTIARS